MSDTKKIRRLADVGELEARLNYMLDAESSKGEDRGDEERCENITVWLYNLKQLPTVDPASCLNWHTGMPPEHDSQCAKLKGTDKWHPWMFEKVSDKVLVTIEDAEGNRCTDVSQTFDGKWKGYIQMEDLKLKIVAWTEMPGPAKEIEDGVH